MLPPSVSPRPGGLFMCLPIALQSESNMREHWASRHHRRARQRVTVRFFTAHFRHVTPPCDVTITRIAPKRLDDDNLVGSAKAVRDEIAALLGVDDADESVTFRVMQTKGEPRTYGVWIDIKERK